MKYNLFLPCLGVFLFILLASSCVKDTDFEQGEDVVITPVVELNLIHFDVSALDFYDTVTMTEQLSLRDTTEIRFLDDSGFQESLVRAEFFFRFKNSIPREFDVDFQFLDSLEQETYFTETLVNPGNGSNEVVTEFTQNVEGDDLLQLTSSDRVVVSVTIPEADADLEGILNLQSKATYFFEIQEQEPEQE